MAMRLHAMNMNSLMSLQRSANIVSRAVCSENPTLNPFISRHDKNVQVSVEIPADLQQLSDDFSRLLYEEINPDVTLTCGDRTWRVHRSVLAVRSEVFAAMFRSGMAESQTDLVRVEDLEAPVLDSLLKYVYSGKMPDMSGDNVFSLYEAGDRYALHSFRKACSYWMIGNMSDENCLNVLAVADAHGDAELKEAVVSFIVEHPALFESSAWINFAKECPTLGVEVLQRFAVSERKCISFPV